jgi:hypothetical protein
MRKSSSSYTRYTSYVKRPRSPGRLKPSVVPLRGYTTLFMTALKGAALTCACKSISFDSCSILLLSFCRHELGCCLSIPVVIGRKGITELCPFSWTIARRRSCPSVHEKSRHRQTNSSSRLSKLVESAPNAAKAQRSSTLGLRQICVHRHRRRRQKPPGQGKSRTYKEPLLPQSACYRGSQLSAQTKIQCSPIMSFASFPVATVVRRTTTKPHFRLRSCPSSWTEGACPMEKPGAGYVFGRQDTSFAVWLLAESPG